MTDIIEDPNDETPDTGPEDTVAQEPSPDKEDEILTPDTVVVSEVKPRRGVGLGALFFMSLLAAGAGAAGGGAISHYLDENVAAAKSDGFGAQFTGVQTNIDDLTSKLTKLETAQANQPAPKEIDVDALTARLKTLEDRPIVTEAGTVIDPVLVSRIEALENIPAQDIDAAIEAFELRLATLEKSVAETPAANSDTAEPGVSEGPSIDSADYTKALARIEALEAAGKDSAEVDLSAITTRLTQLESAPEAEPVDMSGFEARIAALETKIEAQAAAFEAREIPKPVDLTPLTARLDQAESQLNAVRSAVPLPKFPREAVLSALATSSGGDQGWISRIWGEHVKVADEVTVDHVAEIEKLLAGDDVGGALARALALPEPGRAAAQEWIDAVKAQRNL